ncbi:MAG TPA: circularly permuted type 2 ATP-grasp protein [Acidimicrobiales bacterium]|nr:circularly permuted type 2 ATP-grasp protein [Acidimicrobiales bacterium]
MGDLFEGYAPANPFGIAAWDEMFDSPGVPRPAAQMLHDALQALPADDFESRCVARDRSFRDRGITFQLSGEERPFPLDLIPRVIAEEEWVELAAGVVQRVKALEALLADVYGRGQILEDRVLPRSLVTSSQHFHRAAFGVDPANGVRIHVAGIDVVRGADGKFRVLEDNIRCPSGVSYVIENRRMMARIFPELFASHRVLSVASYPARLLEALRRAAPAGAHDPTVVVLTPGVYNSAYFEHSFLARQMGVELVEGRDLICRSDKVYMRTSSGEQRVDVVYRRVDDDFLDPLHFRPDSLVGCPGILNAARAGNVALANAVGNGVADDKLTYTYMPDIIRYYLGEEPILPNVETYRLEDADQLAYVLERIDQLVVKPVAGSGGYGILIGPQASDQELNQARAALSQNPRAWTAQEIVTLSTAPTRIGDRLAPRHLDLRPFAVNDGEHIWVLPGGLTRVALPAGSLVVNSSQGGGSKDTWVALSDPLPCLGPPGGSTVERFRAHSPAAPSGPRDPRTWAPAGQSGTGTGIRPERGPGIDDTVRQQQQQQQQRASGTGGGRTPAGNRATC